MSVKQDVPKTSKNSADMPDRLSAEEIASYSKHINKEKIHIFETLDSTNNKAKDMALKGALHGTVVIAEAQTAGKGRLGRSFVSPQGSGIYMSMVLRIGSDISKAVLITTAAAVSVCKAVRSVTGVDAGIKWVNDIYLNSRKICGILAEAVTNVKTGELDSVVVGIGVNFCSIDKSSYPDDVLERITWLYDGTEAETTRSRLAAAIIDEVIVQCSSITDRSFIDYYKKHAIMLDKDVICIRGNERWQAHTVDIDDNGGLIVRGTDGKLQTLSSGEISIRW